MASLSAWLGVSGFNDFALVSQSPLPAWLFVVSSLAVFVAFLLSARAYVRAGRRYWWLVALHGLASVLVVTILFQPALDLRAVTYTPGRVAVVVDDSASMLQKDGGELTRQALVERFFEEHESDFEELRQRHQVELYNLAGLSTLRLSSLRLSSSRLSSLKLSSLKLSSSKTASRAKSGLIEAVEQPLLTSSSARPLSAVVLISDGGDTEALGRAGSEAAWASALEPLKKFKTPINTVAVGQGQAADLFIADLTEDPIAFVRNTFKLEVTVGWRGPGELEVPVTLKREGSVVRQVSAHLNHNETTKVNFDFVPDQVGEFVYSVDVPVQPGETVTDNNQRDFIIKVVRDKIRALLVAGRPSWDERFLRRTLRSSSNVDLISFFILRTPSDFQAENTSLIPFPTFELFNTELHTFDVVILLNFDYRPYDVAFLLPNLRDHVLQGGAMMMLGGENSFGGGAYGQTPLADILPVRMSEGVLDAADFTPVVTAAGEKHPALRLSAGSLPRQKVVERLPKLSGVMKVDGLADQSTALLVHPTLKTSGGQPMPVLAVREAGKGRTLALTTDSLWQWSFVDKMQGNTGSSYERLIGQMLRWLMRDPDVSRLRLVVSSDKVRVGDKVDIEARVLGADYQPAQNVATTIELRSLAHPELPATLLSGVTNADGAFSAPYVVENEGVVRALGSVQLDDERLESSLLVYADDAGAERAALAARPDVLSRLAAFTGGSAQTIDHFSTSRLKLPPAQVATVDRHQEVPLWNTWIALLAVALTLSAEWVLRRRWGFV